LKLGDSELLALEEMEEAEPSGIGEESERFYD
jgi:hypothetical protein